MKLFEQYIGLWESLKLYWRCYGGAVALLGSPYLAFAIIITLVCHPVWLICQDKPWFEYPLSILPNVLGVTLAGYALLLAFGDDQFKKLFAGDYPDGAPSPFLVINAKFIHFLLVQTMAIFLSVIGSTLGLKTGWFAFLGFMMFIYSFSTAVAAAFAALSVAKSFDDLAKVLDETEPN